jgi:signal transduction histidine kinase
MYLSRRLASLAEEEDLPQGLGEILVELRQHVVEAAAGLRAIVTGLRPPALDQLGLVPALKSLCADLEDQTGILVTLDVLGTTVRLPSEVELGAFRIVQESASNVARHAEAGAIKVSARFEEKTLNLEISDNGRGFDPNTLDEHTGEHLGVVGMRERTRLLGGSFEIHSSPTEGTTVKTTIPIHPTSSGDSDLSLSGSG